VHGPYSTRTQGLGLTAILTAQDDGMTTHGEWMMFRNFNFSDIALLEVMLATVALCLPVLAFTLF
jgi:hypothetical protein